MSKTKPEYKIGTWFKHKQTKQPYVITKITELFHNNKRNRYVYVLHQPMYKLTVAYTIKDLKLIFQPLGDMAQVLYG